MNEEIIRNLIFSADKPRQDAYAERESFETMGTWSPFLGTRSTSEQRADRATRLRNASREAEERRKQWTRNK